MSYRRAAQDRQKLIKLFQKTSNTYGAGVWYDEDAQRYKRYWFSYKSGYPRYLKRLCNKRVRRYRGELKGNEYRKVSGYNWMLY